MLHSVFCCVVWCGLCVNAALTGVIYSLENLDNCSITRVALCIIYLCDCVILLGECVENLKTNCGHVQ